MYTVRCTCSQLCHIALMLGHHHLKQALFLASLRPNLKTFKTSQRPEIKDFLNGFFTMYLRIEFMIFYDLTLLVNVMCVFACFCFNSVLMTCCVNDFLNWPPFLLTSGFLPEPSNIGEIPSFCWLGPWKKGENHCFVASFAGRRGTSICRTVDMSTFKWSACAITFFRQACSECVLWISCSRCAPHEIVWYTLYI